MKKRIVSVALILAIGIGILFLQSSVAWQTNKFDRPQNMTIGTLLYDFEGTVEGIYDSGTAQYVAPGANLLFIGSQPGALNAYNRSTITTQIRVKVEYTRIYWNGSAFVSQFVPYSDSDYVPDDLVVTFAEPALWEYVAYVPGNPNTGCWFYKPAVDVAAPYDIPAFVDDPGTPDDDAGNIIALISFLGYRGDIEDSPSWGYVDSPVSIKLTVEAKQADYVDWATVYTDIWG